MRRVLLALFTVVLVVGTFSACVVVVSAFAGYEYEISADEGHWPDSVEFRQLMSGGERFSEHETNIGGVTIVVDHETGNQYLCTPEGVTGLTDADGTPLRVWEATDDGED